MTTSAVPLKVRHAVYERDEHRCVRCGEPLRPGWRSLQHRIRRGMGGSRHANTMANLIALCGDGTTGCHGETESCRFEARQLGYAVLSWENPEQVPVLYHGREWRYLTDNGWVPAPELGGDAA